MARRRAAVLLACVYSPIVPSTRIGTPSRRGLQVFIRCLESNLRERSPSFDIPYTTSVFNR